jgi:hypothetical protein
VRSHADALWVNIIDDPPLPVVHAIAEDLSAAGWTPRTVIPIVSVYQGSGCLSGNVLLGTEHIDQAKAEMLVPFATIDHLHAYRAWLTYRAALKRVASWPLVQPVV